MRLSVDHLTLCVAKQTIIKDISFELKSGQSLSIIGPSGSGKTSLLKGLLGIAHEFVVSGRITFDPEQRGEGTPCERPHLGYIPQDLALWPHLSVEDTLRLAFLFANNRPCGSSKSPQQVLHLCGLTGLAKKKPWSLSGGEKQRLALARALVGDPHVLVLDEPFSGLDIVAKTTLIALIRSLKSTTGFSVISVSHDLAETLALADQIMILDQGEKIWMGKKHNLSSACFRCHWNPLLSPLSSTIS